jgi:hypothetical protein
LLFVGWGRRTFEAHPDSGNESRILRIALFSAFFILLGGWLIVRAVADNGRPSEGLMFDVTKGPTPTFVGQVINAQPALPGQWPATFVFVTSEGNCTSTAVGRRVILTAAHCVADREELHVQLESGNVPMTCYRIPAHSTDPSADYALCLVDVPLPDLGVGFERIGTDAHLTKRPAQLLLTGYGCTTDHGVPDFGHLYQAFATIADPSLDPSRGQNHILFDEGGALCFGDSGGGAYWEASEKEITGSRLLVGINDKGNNKISWVSKTASSVFVDWAQAQARSWKVSICGITPQEDNCRS